MRPFFHSLLFSVEYGDLCYKNRVNKLIEKDYSFYRSSTHYEIIFDIFKNELISINFTFN